MVISLKRRKRVIVVVAPTDKWIDAITVPNDVLDLYESTEDYLTRHCGYDFAGDLDYFEFDIMDTRLNLIHESFEGGEDDEK
jgi:hypothetical protein